MSANNFFFCASKSGNSLSCFAFSSISRSLSTITLVSSWTRSINGFMIFSAVAMTWLSRSSLRQLRGVPPEVTSGGTPRSWRNEDLESQVMATAEKIMKPLMDRVQELTKVIVLKDLEIEEKAKQLKLLPDFEAQKKKLLADIEAERKASEIQFNKVKEKEEEAKAL